MSPKAKKTKSSVPQGRGKSRPAGAHSPNAPKRTKRTYHDRDTQGQITAAEMLAGQPGRSACLPVDTMRTLNLWINSKMKNHVTAAKRIGISYESLRNARKGDHVHAANFFKIMKFMASVKMRNFYMEHYKKDLSPAPPVPAANPESSPQSFAGVGEGEA